MEGKGERNRPVATNDMTSEALNAKRAHSWERKIHERELLFFLQIVHRAMWKLIFERVFDYLADDGDGGDDDDDDGDGDDQDAECCCHLPSGNYAADKRDPAEKYQATNLFHLAYQVICIDSDDEEKMKTRKMLKIFGNVLGKYRKFLAADLVNQFSLPSHLHWRRWGF